MNSPDYKNSIIMKNSSSTKYTTVMMDCSDTMTAMSVTCFAKEEEKFLGIVVDTARFVRLVSHKRATELNTSLLAAFL